MHAQHKLGRQNTQAGKLATAVSHQDVQHVLGDSVTGDGLPQIVKSMLIFKKLFTLQIFNWLILVCSVCIRDDYRSRAEGHLATEAPLGEEAGNSLCMLASGSCQALGVELCVPS